MSEMRVYQMGPAATLAKVAGALEDYLTRIRGMEAQGVFQGEDAYFIQTREQKEWKRFAGMDKAVQVRLTVRDGWLSVDVGAGQWMDKLGAAAVGYFVFAPLLITAAIGAIDQEKLPREIFDFIGGYLVRQGGGAQPAPDWSCPPPASGAVCQNCRNPLPAGARFCSQCGQPVPEPKLCPRCGARAEAGARFCTGCGAALD